MQAAVFVVMPVLAGGERDSELNNRCYQPDVFRVFHKVFHLVFPFIWV